MTDVARSRYYEGSDEEITRADALELVESGAITDETMIYSDEEAFYFEGWTSWCAL
jgi:hypothetical protein